MDVKTAVALAKDYIKQIFAEEGIGDLGLEEVMFDDRQGVWQITLGFSRAWDRNPVLPPRREYKVVAVAEDGKVLSVKHRLTASA
ncbi:MAG TPA: hypothetical protein VG735_14295 [Caulobacterales bacterium]|jgi:hypothetical protein|nr:hypothetical protein [Caulobacterales bacterium]